MWQRKEAQKMLCQSGTSWYLFCCDSLVLVASHAAHWKTQQGGKKVSGKNAVPWGSNPKTKVWIGLLTLASSHHAELVYPLCHL